MNSWAPLWSNVVDSSLWCEPDFVLKVFLTMLVKKDANHVVWGSAFNVAQWSKKTEAETLEAIKILSSPDTKRLEPQPFDGRRIEKVEGGWLILNGEKYRAEISKLKRREYKRVKQAEYRAKWKEEGRTKKSADSVHADNMARERRFLRAERNGDQEAMDRIAAEGTEGNGGPDAAA